MSNATRNLILGTLGAALIVLLLLAAFSSVAYADADLSARLTVGNQGEQDSCVAWAVAGAKQVAWGKLFSPAYIYNQRELYQRTCDEDQGMTVGDAARTVRNGCALEREFPYDAGDPCTLPQSTDQYRTAEARLLFGGQGNADVEELKAWLDSGFPIVVSIPLYMDYFSCRCDYAMQGPQYWYSTPLCHHAVLIVGYDALGFKFANSIGTDWACDGYGWFTEDFAREYMWEAWVLTEEYPHKAYLPEVRR